MSDRWARAITVAAVLLVAGVAAVVSYCHMLDLAILHGEGWRARIIPLSVDGMLVAATLAIVSQRRAGHRAAWVPWLGLTLGIVASLAANVAAARPDLIARLVAAWPPVALAISIETLVVVLRQAAVGVLGHTQDVPGDQTSGDAHCALVAGEPSSLSKTATGAFRVATLPVAFSETTTDPPSAQPEEVDPLLAQAREIVERSGQLVGRNRLARELGITAHRARQLLSEIANGSEASA